MRFEEALTIMRTGKKITHSMLGENAYLMACRVGLPFDDTPFEERPISIVKMLGDKEHPDYLPEVFQEPCKHGYFPQLNLFLIISDEWEVLE